MHLMLTPGAYLRGIVPRCIPGDFFFSTIGEMPASDNAKPLIAAPLDSGALVPSSFIQINCSAV